MNYENYYYEYQIKLHFKIIGKYKYEDFNFFFKLATNYSEMTNIQINTNVFPIDKNRDHHKYVSS